MGAEAVARRRGVCLIVHGCWVGYMVEPILSHIWDRWKLDFISTVVGIGRGVWWGQREWRDSTTFRTNLLGLMVNIDYTDPRDQLGCPMLQELSQRE